MNVDVSRDLVKRLARRLGWPPTKLGTLMLADEGAWRYALARAQPTERVALLLALEPELLACTEGGRARLAAQSANFYDDVDDEPTFVGDQELLPVVKAALALAPPVVRYAVLRETAFLAVGISCRAWMGSAAFVDVTGRRKERVIELGPDVDMPDVLHEIAHVWNSGPQHEHSQAITAQGEAGLYALAAKDGWVGRIDRWRSHEETLADGLALAWLYASPEAMVKPS